MTITPPPGTSAPSRRATREASKRKHDGRRRLASALAADTGGVVLRQTLLAAGLTRGEVRTEIDRGAWHAIGWRTICVDGVRPSPEGQLWHALWESGERSVLDGPTALLAWGLAGWTEPRLHISVPDDMRIRRLEGVRHHVLRDLGDHVPVGLRRTSSAVAAVRAAQWASTDRQAATLLAMTVQQKLVPPSDVMALWATIKRTPRRAFLDAVIADVCDGAQSMNELDFARLCRRRGLPEPTRQAVRTGPRGRVFLDVYWEAHRLHVEIQGAHHYQGVAGIDDALRFNDLGLRDAHLVSLQIPVLGLRICPDAFLDQVERALRHGNDRQRA